MVSSLFFKEGILEVYWVYYICIYLWDKRTQHLGVNQTYTGKKAQNPIHRDVIGKTDLL